MSHVRAPSRETAAAGPGPGLDQTASFVRELYGQDFGLRVGSQDNHPPLQFTNTDVLDRVDPLAIVNEARAMQQRELRRLFAAPVVWLVKAVVRWNERNILRRRLQEMPDYMLKDIGIRRDQIEML